MKMKEKNKMWEGKKILIIGLAYITAICAVIIGAVIAITGVGYMFFVYVAPSIKPFITYLDSFYSGIPFMIGMMAGLFFVSNYVLYKVMPKWLKKEHKGLHSKDKTSKDKAKFEILVNEFSLFAWSFISIFTIKYGGIFEPSMAGVGWFILTIQLITIIVYGIITVQKPKKKKRKKYEIKHNKKSGKTIHTR